MLVRVTKGFPRAKKLIRICWRSRVVRTSLRLREGLNGPYTPKDAAVCWASRTNLFKAVIFDVASGSGTIRGVDLSRGNATNTSEGVPESFVTSGWLFLVWRVLLSIKLMEYLRELAWVMKERARYALRQWTKCLCKKLHRKKRRSIYAVSQRKVCRKNISNWIHPVIRLRVSVLIKWSTLLVL